MRSPMYMALAASVAVPVIMALAVDNSASPGVVQLHMNKRAGALGSRSSRRSNKRQGGIYVITDENYEHNLLYLVEVDVGTPPQKVRVQLDTGSADLVLETDSSDVCSQPAPNPCEQFGAYNANSSSTYKYLNSDLNIAYAGGDGATGDYATDTVSIGGATVSNLQIGIMYKSTILEGILGVSYVDLEAQDNLQGKEPYDNILVLLVKQGSIASRAYSLWTNDDRSASGELILGGIDTQKYCGSLVFEDLVPSDFRGELKVTEFEIALKGIDGTDANGNAVEFAGSATAGIVLLDSGTTFTDVDNDLADAIWNFVGATVSSTDASQATLPCTARQSKQTINFILNGLTINIPMTQLVVFPDETDTICKFGIEKNNGGKTIIGDTALSSIYVVYDLDNKQLALAPAILNAAASNFLPISSGPNAVPRVSGPPCPAPSTVKSSSSIKSTAASSTSSSSSSTSKTVSSSSTKTPTSTLSSTVSKSSPATTTKAPVQPTCNRDNCYRAAIRSMETKFCSAYTKGIATAVPSGIAKQCSSSASRISSACSCLNASTA